MKIFTNKTNKEIVTSIKSTSETSINNNNNADENHNISKENNINNIKNKSLINNKNIPEITKEKLQKLKYIFPFLNEEINNSLNEYTSNNYSKSEYNKIVSKINKNNSLINGSKNDEEILEGKINIIDKVIQKHMPSSNDTKIINQGLTSLSLKIDKNFNMMNDIGYRLPNLIELNLNGSEIESIMDIGTNFKKLEKLDVSNCGLNDLSGIICFKNLKELYASNNKISDLIDIEMCDELKIIDLSNNLITDENNLLFFNSCQKLQKIILIGNKFKKFNQDLIDRNIHLVI